MELLAKGKVLVVAEVGLAHCGCLGTAMAFVDAVKAAGADAIKFQDHLNDSNDRFRGNMWFPQDPSRTQYWERTAFSDMEWARLSDHASSPEFAFGVSAFSVEAAQRWAGLCGVDFWKVGSGQLKNAELLEFIAARAKPVILSSGMSPIDEVGRAVAALEGLPVAVLQCTSRYPSKPEDVGINVMRQFLRLAPFVGLSDHSGTIYPSLAAATLGADVLEVHVCWDKRQWGPDVSSSITIDQLKQLVEGVRFIEKMRANPVDKDAMAERLKDTRAMFMGGKA